MGLLLRLLTYSPVRRTLRGALKSPAGRKALKVAVRRVPKRKLARLIWHLVRLAR